MKRLGIVLLIVFCSSAANAANLLTNAHFDSGIAGWTPPGAYGYVTTLWGPLDAMSSPSSGSFVFINADPEANGAGPYVLQCVPATAGVHYDLGVKVRIAAGQTNTGYGSAMVQFMSGANCSGTVLETRGAGGVPGTRFAAHAARDIVAPVGTNTARIMLVSVKNEPGGALSLQYDDVFLGPTGSCVPDGETLCLNDGRFSVRGWYWSGSGDGNAQVEQLTSDSGYLWFFNAANVEVIVKVLNACGVNSRQWVFAGGLTNVNTRIDVTDMKTGVGKSYLNPASTPFEPVQDTDAFSTCP